jgi:sulfide:quinone oxidoreductase
MPFQIPIPPSPDASKALFAAFAERDIEWVPERIVTALDPDRKVAVCSDGSEIPYDLFLGVPVHRAPKAVTASALAVDGWIPVDTLTLETAFPGVFAVGDVTSAGTPKAGVFAEGQATVVAAQIIARIRDAGPPATYDGKGVCYLEFGHDLVGKVTVTFLSGEAQTGGLEGPSEAIATDKVAFGTSRVQRWFDRQWAVG